MSPRPTADGPAIEGLQYLRAIAALMVVFHHARWQFPADSLLMSGSWEVIGSRGVDIFFVISGFVMVHSTQAFDPASARLRQAADFLLKRFIRVAPLYWFATTVLALRTLSKGGDTGNMLLDFLFIPHDNGHGLIWPLLFQGWTINYEMFFYLLFALAMLLGRYRLVAVSAVLLALTVSGLTLVTGSRSPSVPTQFYTSSLLFEFALGMWLCLAMQRFRLSVPRPVLIGVTVWCLWLLATPVPERLRGLADGPLAVLIVWSGVLWMARTDWRWLRALGDASYSIYLFHFMLFGKETFLLQALHLTAPTPVNMVVAVGLSLVMASALGLLVHRMIERPLLQWCRTHLRRTQGRPAAPPAGPRTRPSSG